MNMVIELESIESPAAVDLLGRFIDELDVRYPEQTNGGGLEASELIPPRGGFFIARLDAAAVGCGCFRELKPGVCELKRMYVDPAHRGKGIGRLILKTLENEARAVGYSSAVLETALRQPEAIGLYESAGWRRISNFGGHAKPELSVCFEKKLI